MVEFIRSAQSLTRADISAVEQQIGATLPEDLKRLYLLHNGGVPSKRFFVTPQDTYEIHTIFPIGPSGSRISFEGSYEILVNRTPDFPREFIPFADDEGGDHFLYSTREFDKGTIHFNQSDYYDDPERYVVRLALSLDEFLNNLREHP